MQRIVFAEHHSLWVCVGVGITGRAPPFLEAVGMRIYVKERLNVKMAAGFIHLSLAIFYTPVCPTLGKSCTRGILTFGERLQRDALWYVE